MFFEILNYVIITHFEIRYTTITLPGLVEGWVVVVGFEWGLLVIVVITVG